MIEILLDSKEWVFSGIGVAFLGLLFGWLFRRRKIEGDKIIAKRGGVAAKTILNHCCPVNFHSKSI